MGEGRGWWLVGGDADMFPVGAHVCTISSSA